MRRWQGVPCVSPSLFEMFGGHLLPTQRYRTQNRAQKPAKVRCDDLYKGCFGGFYAAAPLDSLGELVLLTRCWQSRVLLVERCLRGGKLANGAV